MDINFDRNRAQDFLEKTIDPSYDPSSANTTQINIFKTKVDAFQLNSLQTLRLKTLVEQDANDYLFNASVSFCNALQGIDRQNYSWAAVELYYCMYYLLRAKVHYNNYVLFRIKGILYLKLANSEKFISTGGNTSNTHKTTLKIFKILFPTDYIFTYEVDFKNSVEWMEDVREIVNYRNVRFSEPNQMSFFDKFKDLHSLSSNINEILKNPTNVFQPEFAMVGLPIVFFQEIQRENSIQMKNIFSVDKIDYLRNIIDTLNLPQIYNFLSLK